MLEFLREYQLNIMLILIGVCGLLAFLVLLTKAIPLKRRFILMAMELCAMFLLIADRYCYIYRGDISDLGYWMVRICNFAVYLMTLFILVIFNLYLGNLCLNEVGLKVLPKRMRVAHLLAAVDFIILVIGIPGGLFFTIDEQNRYQRAEGFFISCDTSAAAYRNMAVQEQTDQGRASFAHIVYRCTVFRFLRSDICLRSFTYQYHSGRAGSSFVYFLSP